MEVGAHLDKVKEKVERIERGIVEAFKDATRRSGEVMRYVVERSPEVARSIVTMSVTGITVAITVATLAIAFPTASALMPLMALSMFMIVNLSVALLVLSLVVGIFRRLVK